MPRVTRYGRGGLQFMAETTVAEYNNMIYLMKKFQHKLAMDMTALCHRVLGFKGYNYSRVEVNVDRDEWFSIYIMTSETSGLEKFAQFQSAYWIEKSLSVDNLFVFIPTLYDPSIPEDVVDNPEIEIIFKFI